MRVYMMRRGVGYRDLTDTADIRVETSPLAVLLRLWRWRVIPRMAYGTALVAILNNNMEVDT